MNRGKGSVVILALLLSVLCGGECRYTEMMLEVVDKSCNSLTVMWTISEAQEYTLQYKPKSQTGNWKKVNTNETMFEITQLLPMTRYTVRVKPGNQSFVKKDFKTLPRTDIADNVTVVASTNSLEIENKLTEVNITCWITGSDTVKNTTISGRSREVVEGLSPNTTYSVDCVEVDEEGQYQCMEYNGTVTTLFEESPPGQPTHITVNKTCNSLTLSWLPPGEDGESIVTDYIVTVVDGTEDGPLLESVPTGGSTTVRITSLKPNTTYTVHIRARNSAGLGPPAVVNVTTEELKVTKVYRTSESAREVTFRLLETSGNFTCTVLGESTDSPVFNSTVSAGTDVTIDTLTPNTTYSIRCTGIEDQCVEVDGMIKTTIIKVPGQPTNITVNKTCNSLTLSWLPPGEDGGSIVTDYIVTVVDEIDDGPLLESVPTGGNTTVRITSLKPNTMYTVHIRARNSAGLGPPAVVRVTTEELSPPLTAASRSARVVSILPVANRTSKSVHRCTLTAHYAFNTSESGGLYRVAFYTTLQGLNISSLLPDTAYSLVCTALLPVDRCTSSYTQFTFKTLPWVTSQVKVGNSFLQNNQLHQSISWRRPPHHTSQLHYIVKYGQSSVVDRPTHPSVNTTTSSNTTVILTLPIPTTPVVYNVWVAAVSDVGQGEYSQRKQVHYTTPMTAPTPIILVNRTCNAITLKWGVPPSTGGLPLLIYTLKISDNLQHSYTNVTSPSVTIRQMEPNTNYTLAVRAVNFIGNSEWTKSVMVTTLKRDGQSIQILRVTPNKIQASINRRWNKVDYNCTISDTDKIIALTVSDGVTFAIPNLSPNTTYDIDCIGAEDQCLEVNTTVTTAATVPSEPTNAIVSQTTHNSAQLKWGAPSQKGGSEIIGYKITFTSLKHSGYYIIGVLNTWELVGLVPDSKYNIEISAINRVGIGTPANLTVRTSATTTHIFPRNIVERGKDTVNVTLSGHGTKVQCDLRDSGQEHSTNTSILLPGHSSVFPLLSRGTDHTLYCTNKDTQCAGLQLTVTVPSCP